MLVSSRNCWSVSWVLLISVQCACRLCDHSDISSTICACICWRQHRSQCVYICGWNARDSFHPSQCRSAQLVSVVNMLICHLDMSIPANNLPNYRVIVDELGRGASTRDGLSIAIAIAEALVDSRASIIWLLLCCSCWQRAYRLTSGSRLIFYNSPISSLNAMECAICISPSMWVSVSSI